MDSHFKKFFKERTVTIVNSKFGKWKIKCQYKPENRENQESIWLKSNNQI